MKNYLDIRNWGVLSSILLFFVFIFTLANNYWFYTYVEYAVKKDVSQLELILNKDLEYFRTKKISNKNYREHTKVIVQQFAKKAQYNKEIKLNYKNAILKSTGTFKKGYEPWEYINPENRPVHSDINILVPELSSNENLKYNNRIIFDKKVFIFSLFRSMTFSFTDVIIDKLNNKEYKYNLNTWTHWKRYYWPRSRNPAIFLIFLGLLLSRIRKYQISLYELSEDQAIRITELEDKISNYQNEDIQKILGYAKNKEVKKLKLLIDTGISIDTKNSEGMTALMLYTQEDSESKDKKEVIQILLDNGANIDEKNNVGMTTLMLCSMYGKDDSAQILIDNGADITIKQELTAADIATETIKEMISKTQNTNPQKLVKLLSSFTIKDSPMKWTAHKWDFIGFPEKLKGIKYKNFDEYINDVKIQLENMKEELNILSPNLYKKIYTFCIEENPNKDDSWCSNSKINMGWSSLDGLKQWCDDGNEAHLFPLGDDKSFTYQGSDITTFDGVMNIFKQEIEIRREFKNLDKIFEKIDDDLPLDFTLNTSKLEKQFYTDTEKFKDALNKIFGEIEKRKKFKNINVFTEDKEDKSIEIKIIQIDSFSEVEPKALLSRVNKGDGNFGELKVDLQDLCDWSMEFEYESKGYRINCLKSNNVKDIVELDYTPKGFTHVLRFY